jgi:rhamnosyltransferase
VSEATDNIKRRVAGVVLAYNPDPEILGNVRALADQADHVYVVDNSPDGAPKELIGELESQSAVSVLPQGGNVGVAAGFNAGIRAALAAGYDDVWIFDQDSTVTNGMLAALQVARARFGDRAGIVGPALRSQATGVIYARETGVGSAPTDVVISSGSLFSRSLLERIGLHDEPLFIDYVDHDICLRAKKRGFRNIKVFDAILDHRFGDSEPVRLLGRPVYLANYSDLRHFYAARNRIIVIRRYGFGQWFWEDLWFTAKAWTKLLLLESHRGTKIAAATRGVWAGLRYDVRS